MSVLISVLLFVTVILALVDIVTRDESQVRGLPKLVWVLLVVFLPLVGSVLWFIVGHDWGAVRESVVSRGPGRSGLLGGGGAPGRSVGAGRAPVGPRPRTTEEQLADLDREIEFHEQQARLRALEAEVERRRSTD